jgi:hypothetical protein
MVRRSSKTSIFQWTTQPFTSRNAVKRSKVINGREDEKEAGNVGSKCDSMSNDDEKKYGKCEDSDAETDNRNNIEKGETK